MRRGLAPDWSVINHKMEMNSPENVMDVTLLNALQINFPSHGIDLEYLWQTERWLSVCWEAQGAKMVQPVNEEHLCLINLPIFVRDEGAAS